ncbi:MAG TPA: hypothetical protein VMZ91_16740 [Candidatus Paceibacterota bacterium]|nr:hypothetical protein [Candidatus Paceibacterota bacterium]
MNYEHTEQEQRNAVPIVVPSERADLLDKLQPGKVVEEIRRKLLGQEMINGNWVTHPYMKARAISEVGAWEISLLMLPASSQNVAMTKLNPTQIQNRLLNITRTAQKMCLRNWQEYNIRGIDQLWFVHEIIFTNTLASLNQPEGEGIRKLLGIMGSADFTPPEQEIPGMSVFRK